MGKKTKLPKIVKQKLREIADMLPVIPTSKNAGTVQQTIMGSKALELGIKANENQDIPKIDPKLQYFQGSGEKVGVNHYKALEKIWIEKGNDGVEAYIAKIKAKNLELIQEEADKKANPPTPEEIQRMKQEDKDRFNRENSGKKKMSKLTGNKNTSKKSK